MIASLQITPPQSSTAQPVNATSVTIQADVNYPTVMTAVIESDWETYYNESDSNSAAQLNAYATYTLDGAYIFRGKCTEIAREIVDGTPTITMTFLDRMNELNHTLAVYKPGSTPYYVWSRATGVDTGNIASLSQVQLYKLPYYEGGYRERWAPKYDSDAWLDTATTAATGQTFTLPSNVTSGDTEIKATTANLGFPPSGLLSMTSGGTTSIVAYNGYSYKQSDGYWYFNNCIWVADSGAGLLGGTAANHAAGTTVYLLASKRLHFTQRILIEGKTGATYEAIENTHYRPNWEDGSIIFSQSPLSLEKGGAYDSIHISAGYYDEDDGNALTLQGLLTDVLQAGHGSLAPSMSLNFSSDLDGIYITRVVVDRPTTAMEFTRGVLNDLGLLRGVSTDAIYMAYSPSANSLKIRTVSQGAPTRYYSGERRRGVTVNMDDVASAVGAVYEQGEAANLIDVERIWHTTSDDAGGGSPPAGAVPRVYHKVAGTWYGPAVDGTGYSLLRPHAWAALQSVSLTGGGGAHPVNLITDNNDATGIMLAWDTAAHCKTNNAFYAWFPGADTQTPDTYLIKKVSLTLEMVGASEDITDATKPGFRAHVKYYTDLTPDSTGPPYTSEPTSAAGSKWLDSRLSAIFKPGTYNTATYTIEADDIYVFGNAVGIEIESPLKDTSTPGGNWYGFKILDFRVEGVPANFAAVQLKASYATSDSKTITAPLSYAKLVDTTIGEHIVKLIDVGAATREVALNFAWLQLLQLLALAQAKEYDVDSTSIEEQGVPELMETVQMSDGTTGVVDSLTYSNVGGVQSLDLRLIDYDTPLFGAAV